MKHRNVTTTWMRPGYFRRFDCVCCGFAMLASNLGLKVEHSTGRQSAMVCDGCVEAVAAAWATLVQDSVKTPEEVSEEWSERGEAS